MKPEREGIRERRVPSMLDLVRLSSHALFPPGGRELYRQIALLTDLKADQEVLVAACGVGVTLEYFVREFGVQGSGVDEDPFLVERAEARARAVGLQERLHFQHGTMANLPYRDGVFDVSVAELGLTARTEPKDAVRELVRVTRSGGRVALVQLVWKAPVEPGRRDALSKHLGARPLMLVELKRLLREAGIENLHTEAWSDEGTAFRPHVKKPFPDFAELFTLPEKLRILRRAWGRWGWSGVRTAVARETQVHRLLTRERILGLDMITGRKAGGEADERRPPASGEEGAEERPPRAPGKEDADTAGQASVRDLPLFHGGGGNG